MKRFYLRPSGTHRFYGKRAGLARALSICWLWLFAHTLFAQQSTFFESFNEGEAGSIPQGWTAWQNGGGGSPPTVWTVMRDGPLGVEQYAMSPEEPGREGLTDEDWLITPRITPQAGDFLIFDTRRGYDDTTDKYRILISTTTAEAPADFTEVFGDYDMSTMPALMDKFKLDLSAYVGVPIHIAFVHIADVGPDSFSGFWLVDEVEVRPIQAAFVADAYFRQATSPPQPPALASDALIFAGSVEFVVNGDYGTANISSLTLSTAGTTDLALVKEIIVYVSPWEAVTDDDILNGVIPVFGSVQNPGATFEITGSADLALDTKPFFYFRYILNEDYEITAPYPQIDIAVEKYVANGVERIPGVTTYFGAMDVVPPTVINDHFADALPLAATPARYWSSTLPATYEEAYDKVAYCHNQGFEEIHSVWWYFIAPSDGTITADLSDSRFNSIVAFFTEDFSQLACNDDINDNKTQSKITDFPVEKGQKIYVRVSDIGGVGANQYRVAGVVAMDFSFSVLTGTTPEQDGGMISLYPNPTAGAATLVIDVEVPGEAAIEVSDVLGRRIQTRSAIFTRTGRQEVPLSLSGQGAGTYFVKVHQGNRTAMRKLSVVR